MNKATSPAVHHYGENNQKDLFHGWFVLQVSPESVYAIDLVMVPKGREKLVERLEKFRKEGKPEGFSLLMDSRSAV
jgi:hypothetical protein